MSKEQWAFLESNFAEKASQGKAAGYHHIYPIRRFYEKLGMGIRTFPDIHYHKVRVKEIKIS